MARIFYSMAGEGRGHAVRVRTLVEHLRREHELVLFASDEAYEFLDRCYGRTTENVRLLRIEGLRFHYTNGRLDLPHSIHQGLKYAWYRLPRLVDAMRRQIDVQQPDLAISDFEPALPRAARREGLPLMTIDHQHVLVAYNLATLPWRLRQFARSMSIAVRWYYTAQNRVLTSSFYSPPLKRGYERVQQIGPLIRPEVAAATPTVGNWITSYLRANTPSQILDRLAECGREVRIYGLGERPRRGNLVFNAISEQGFVRDLAGCEAVVAAAGNQLLGESLFLGKPVLAMPEQAHHEQSINAHFIREMGVGDWVMLEHATAQQFRHFFEHLPKYRLAAEGYQGHLDGTHHALAAIREELSLSARRKRALSANPSDDSSQFGVPIGPDLFGQDWEGWSGSHDPR